MRPITYNYIITGCYGLDDKIFILGTKGFIRHLLVIEFLRMVNLGYLFLRHLLKLYKQN